jgi:catechol 2,3-dioxygenase-like lactoylglutathione lyase family enzyme
MTEIIGIDHIYITVSDLNKSELFYDNVFGTILGFKKNNFIIGTDLHIQYYNRHFGYVIRPAKNNQKYDKYSSGLHHICLRVESIADVKDCADKIKKIGIEISEPQNFIEYAPDYWATYFQDPNGIQLEITNYRQERKDRFLNFDNA